MSTVTEVMKGFCALLEQIKKDADLKIAKHLENGTDGGEEFAMIDEDQVIASEHQEHIQYVLDFIETEEDNFNTEEYNKMIKQHKKG